MTSSPNDNETTPESIGSDALRASLFSKLFDKKAETVSVGRYRILDEIGAGGMGQVFSAYDEELDRKVAIKVVHGASTSQQAKGRLRREAQALGRLAHPNVVTVHEIGEHNGQVFIAMEFVRGETLRQWRLAQERSVPEILEVYLQAARGLQAAHEAGILHRDFKPDNALVGDDGRVRVLDFGLAREVEDERAKTLPDGPSKGGHGDVALTKTGAILGTPSYMAPEQFLGEETDARTDQFALCVSLWEALYGDRPFAGSLYSELEANVTAGLRGSVSRDVAVPGSVRAMLETGLAVDPAKRHPDLSSIVTTLQSVLSPRRSRWWIAATTVPLAALGGFVFLQEPPAARSLEDCLPAAQRLAGIWDDEVKETLALRYGVSGEPPFVASTWRFQAAQQDAFVAEWTESYERACSNASSPDTATRRLAAQRLDCLDLGLTKLIVMPRLAQVTTPRKFAAGFHGTHGGVQDEMTCRGDAFVRRVPAAPSDPETAAQVIEATGQLFVVTEKSISGAPADGLEPAQRLVEEARSIGYPPLVAEALARVAFVHMSLRDAGAVEAVGEALRAAEVSGNDLLILMMLKWHARLGERPLESLDRAEAVLVRIGSPLDARVELSTVRAVALDAVGRSAEAYALLLETLETHGDDERVPLRIRYNAHVAFAELSHLRLDPAARLAAARTAFTMTTAAVGDQHPASAVARDLSAYALFELGRYEEAVAEYRGLESALLPAAPEGTPRLGVALAQRGRAEEAVGLIAQSKRSFEASEVMLSRQLGPTNDSVLALPMLYLAGRALQTGDEAEFRARMQIYRDTAFEHVAVPLLFAVVAALDEQPDVARAELTRTQGALDALGPVGADATIALRPLVCYVHLLLGDDAAALADAAALVSDKPQPAYLSHGATAMAGLVYAEAGDHALALPALERALKQAATAAPPTIAWYSPMAHYALALSLEETGEHERAVKVARIAVTQARLTGLPRLNIGDKAQAWLAEHES